MMVLQKANDRFHTKIDWLESWHSFSFGHHYDEKRMGFGPLRVINDDIVAAGGGFPTHPHNNMEIITVVLDGALAHKDSLGTGSTIRPGDVQKMSAGSGIRHSEFNASQTEAVHLLQLWIMPDKENVKPEYQQVYFEPSQWQNQLCLVCGPHAMQPPITLYQDAKLFVGRFEAGKTASYSSEPARNLYVHVATGALTLNGQKLTAGDGAMITQETKLDLKADQLSQVLLFDLPD